MLSIISNHKGKIGIGIGALALAAYLYKNKARINPIAVLSGRPSSVNSIMVDKAEEEVRTTRDRIYKSLIVSAKQKLREGITFVNAQMDQCASIKDVKEALNEGKELVGTEPLIRVLNYTFSLLFLQRFIHLLQLVQRSVLQKKLVPKKSIGEELKREEIKKVEEEKKEKISPMLSIIQSKNQQKSEMALVAQEESNAFCLAVISYINNITKEIGALLIERIKKRSTQMSNEECSNLLPEIFTWLKEQYCTMKCKQGKNPQELSSFCLVSISNFGTIIEEGEKKFPDFKEIKTFIESVYFQSLFMQGIDIDFHDLNAEYQKMVALAFQGIPQDGKINNKDLIAVIIKGQNEWAKKIPVQYGTEIESAPEDDYLNKMLKLFASELNKNPGEAVNETYKQSLRDFITLILFEEVKQSPLGGLPSPAELDFY